MIIKRYSLFGSSAKSILTSDQGAFGIGDIKSGSRLDSGVEIKHAQHDWTFFSTILSIPGAIFSSEYRLPRPSDHRTQRNSVRLLP